MKGEKMEPTFENIKKTIQDAGIEIDVEALEPGKTFEDMGIDSLDTFNVLLAVEEAFGVKIPEEMTDELNTIDKITGYLKSQKA